MTITFWGVRNSLPVCDKEFLDIGGNTSCISIESQDGKWIVIDGGTGMINLGQFQMAGKFSQGKGIEHIFFSHFYWDHIQGFPFYIPNFIPGNEINLYGFSDSKYDLRTILENQMEGIFSPIYSLDNFASNMSFTEINNNTLNIGTIEIKTQIFPHAGSHLLGFRLKENDKTVVIITELDVTQNDIKHNVAEFARNADVLIHEAFKMTEKDDVQGWGHASSNDAIDIAQQAYVPTLILNLYSPDIPDGQIYKQEKTLNTWQTSVKVIAAYEGLELEI